MIHRISGLLSLCLIPIVFAGCGKQQKEPSQLQDVSSPGQAGDNNILIWQDQNMLYRGMCLKDVLPTRTNCATNLSKITIEASKKNTESIAQSELQKASSMVAIEIKALKDADPTIVSLRKTIETLTTQKNELSNSTPKLIAELKTKESLRTNLEEAIAIDDTQLAAIETKLAATPNDPVLLKLKVQLTDERSGYHDRWTLTVQEIDSLQKRISWEQSTRADIEAAIANTQTQLKSTYDAVVVNSPKLEGFKKTLKAKEDGIASISSVYDLISQGDITYRTNLLTQSQQQAFLWISSTNPSNILKAGVYKVESGYQSFCPQNIEPKISNGKLTSLAVTYLSPCSGTYHTYSCQENKCSYSSSVYIIIQSMDHYAFSSSGNNAVFKFDHNSLGTDIGTVEASATERLDH